MPDFDNRVQIVHAAQCNALRVLGPGGIVATRENPVSWEDRASLDYLGARRERSISVTVPITQERAEELADEYASRWFHGWVEYQGDWETP